MKELAKKFGEMEALGRQILVELYGCTASIINDESYVKEVMLAAVKASRATIIAHKIHKFCPQGVSGVVIIAESHVSIHTWPEHQYVALDIFTCGNKMQPRVVCEKLKTAFEATYTTSKDLKRGVFDITSKKSLRLEPAEAEQK